MSQHPETDKRKLRRIKYCPVCGDEKITNSQNRNICRRCVTAQVTARRRADPVKAAEQAHAVYMKLRHRRSEARLADPLKKEKDRQHYLKYHTQERYKESRKKWVENNIQRVRETKRRSHQKHWVPYQQSKKKAFNNTPHGKMALLTSLQKRRALKARSEITVTTEEIKELFRSATKCCYCEKPFGKSHKDKKTLDHIVPLSKQGPHSIGNLAVACGSCNCRKKDRDLVEFLSDITHWTTRISIPDPLPS